MKVQSIRPLQKSLGLRKPAEWAPHDATWLSWPHDLESFGEGLAGTEQAYVDIISALHKSERVELLTSNDSMLKRVSQRLSNEGVDLSRVRFHIYPYQDVWFRDYGPTFVASPTGKIAMVHWIFNAWGDKYEELKKDTNVPLFMERTLGFETLRPGIVMEGGSIDVNGAGTLMTTEQCLLNKNRNPSLSRPEIEGYLSHFLGVTHFIWLKEGIAGDDTDGHIDDIARFVSPDTVVCALEEKALDANHEPLRQCFDALKKARNEAGKPLNVVPLPMPEPVEADGRRLPASYANFLIANTVVLVPVFGCPQDEFALKALEPLFPSRKIIPVLCRDLVRGLGTIHCVSQQQPCLHLP